MFNGHKMICVTCLRGGMIPPHIYIYYYSSRVLDVFDFTVKIFSVRSVFDIRVG